MVAPWGLDKSTWDPSSDNFLPQSYSADDMKGKSVCKTTLQQHLDLPEGAAKIHVEYLSHRTLSSVTILLQLLKCHLNYQLLVQFVLLSLEYTFAGSISISKTEAFQVGCIYSDLSDDDLQNLKTLVWMVSRSGIQVSACGVLETFLRKKMVKLLYHLVILFE